MTIAYRQDDQTWFIQFVHNNIQYTVINRTGEPTRGPSNKEVYRPN